MGEVNLHAPDTSAVTRSNPCAGGTRKGAGVTRIGGTKTPQCLVGQDSEPYPNSSTNKKHMPTEMAALPLEVGSHLAAVLRAPLKGTALMHRLPLLVVREPD